MVAIATKVTISFRFRAVARLLDYLSHQSMRFARDDPHPSCSSRARSAVTEISLVGAIKMLRHSHCKDISTMQLSWLKSEPLVFFVTSMASLRNAARKTSQGNTNRISVFALNRNPNQHMQTNMYPLDKPVTISPNFWVA